MERETATAKAAATVGFNLEALPGTPTGVQAGGFPRWLIFTIAGAGVAVAAIAITARDGEPDSSRRIVCA